MRLDDATAERISRLAVNSDFAAFRDYLLKLREKYMEALVMSGGDAMKVEQGRVRMLEEILNDIAAAPTYRKKH